MNIFVGEVLKNGIEFFDVLKLVFIIISESDRYMKINVLKEKLLVIFWKVRKMWELVKKGGMKVLKLLRESFGFFELKKSN